MKAFAKQVNETQEQLDTLVNNAGLAGFYHSTSKDGCEVIFQVNYLRHFLLGLLEMEKLKKSAPSRIDSVSSKASEYNRDLQISIDDFKVPNQKLKFDGLYRYSESKLAQVVFTKELGRRLEGQRLISA